MKNAPKLRGYLHKIETNSDQYKFVICAAVYTRLG